MRSIQLLTQPIHDMKALKGRSVAELRWPVAVASRAAIPGDHKSKTPHTWPSKWPPTNS
jgi:hypothetical protein